MGTINKYKRQKYIFLKQLSVAATSFLLN